LQESYGDIGNCHIEKGYSIFQSVGKVFRRFFWARLFSSPVSPSGGLELPKKVLSKILLVSDRFSPEGCGSVVLESRFNDELGNWPRRQVGSGKINARLFPRWPKHLIF
jgi:hypothetical protein